jgi:secondary thiamine-phosphate synthase enzyme
MTGRSASTVETLGVASVSRVAHGRLTVRTSGEAFLDLTADVGDWLAGLGAQEGAVCAFVAHTTASLTLQENADPDVLRDLVASLRRLAPQGPGYSHAVEGPDDMPAHIRTMLTDCSLTLPVTRGQLMLGTWQAIYLVEHRSGGRHRTVHLTFIGA